MSKVVADLAVEKLGNVINNLHSGKNTKKTRNSIKAQSERLVKLMPLKLAFKLYFKQSLHVNMKNFCKQNNLVCAPFRKYGFCQWKR